MTTIPGKYVMVPTRNILNGEAACRCGCGLKPNAEILICLQAFAYRLERRLGKPIRITITSMARCSAHNAAVGGEPHSRHMLPSDAADTKWQFREPGQRGWVTLDADFVANEAIASGMFGGVGWKRYQGKEDIVHLDCRMGPVAIW